MTPGEHHAEPRWFWRDTQQTALIARQKRLRPGFIFPAFRAVLGQPTAFAARLSKITKFIQRCF
jgi:hypothetical protein